MKKLIHDLKKNSSKAQRKLFVIYSDYLYRICFRYLCNRDDAHDVLSQSFLNIFNKISETDIQEEVVLKAWMKRIAINQSLMQLRKRKMFFMELDLIEEIEESPLTTDGNLLEDDLVNMLLSLPDGYRTVFSLYVIEGYKHDEIAEKLGITVSTSKSQLRKARLQLKGMIEKVEKRYEEAR